jgi:signal transduction histidine kinase/sugar lactone lactonase YvrE
VLKFDITKKTFKRYLSDLNHPDYKARNQLINLYGEPKKNNPSQSILWMGSIAEGMIRFDCENEQFKYYADDPTHVLNRIKYQIQSIYPDPQQKNIVWIGTNAGGLFKYDKQKSVLKQNNHHPDDSSCLSHSFVQHILRDRAGHLWISTRGGGLNRMVEEDETFIHYKYNPADTNSISHNWVNIIFESSSGVLWLGTRDGINKFDRLNNLFHHYSEKDGLPSNVVHGILEDRQGYLWLTTTNGLSRFNPKVPGKKAFRNYDVGDGLHGNEFTNKAYFQSKSGEIYAGGIRGFTVFHPDNLGDNPHIPKIVLTDLQIYDKSLKPGKNSTLKQTISQTRQITLNYSQNTLTLEFSALEYLNPSKNKYAYKMEGIDQDWVYTDASRRFATYTQLDPGDYVFRVKGSNNDGLWNEDGTSLRIIITPPWWRTTWAYSVYILLVVLTLYALRIYDRKRQRLKHELEMEHMHAIKLEEIDGMKSRFFANISHEFRTPLTLILGPVQSILAKIRDVGLKNELNLVLRNTTRLERLVNQLLDLSRLEAGKMNLQVEQLDIIPLLRKIVLAFTSWAERKKISLKFKSRTKSLFTYIDQDKIEKIMNNLLSNAFKFTPEGGRISVTASELHPPQSPLDRGERSISPLKKGDTGGCNKTNSEFPVPNSDFVEITISNTGPGIPADKIDKIFDRFYQVDDSYTRDHEGTGIGLSLVKELVFITTRS